MADAVPDAEPEREPEAEPEPTALADDGRGTTGVGVTTMEEEEEEAEEGVMMGEELGLERGVRTGTETGMTGEEEGVWVLAGAAVEELIIVISILFLYVYRCRYIGGGLTTRCSG